MAEALKPQMVIGNHVTIEFDYVDERGQSWHVSGSGFRKEIKDGPGDPAKKLSVASVPKQTDQHSEYT